MREYTKLFSFDTVAGNAVGKIDFKVLEEHLTIIGRKSLEVIKTISATDLEGELEPTKLRHPVAKTKLEALSWNIKHTMWHYGQIAMIKRVVDKAYDYGLKRY